MILSCTCTKCMTAYRFSLTPATCTMKKDVWYTEVSREPRIICLRHGDTIQIDSPKVSVPQESGPARQAGLFRLYNS